MDAVAVAAEAPWTWEALAAAGCTCAVEIVGLTAPRVACWAPKPSLGRALRAALDWRIAAMRAHHAAQAHRPAHQQEALVARIVDGGGRGHCGSCGEAWSAGDCPLCNAARVAALRASGLLPPAVERPSSRERSRIERHRADLPASRPLDRTSPHWWACSKGHDNWGPRTLGCGPCEAAGFGFVDLSALGGGR